MKYMVNIILFVFNIFCFFPWRVGSNTTVYSLRLPASRVVCVMDFIWISIASYVVERFLLCMTYTQTHIAHKEMK